MDYQALLKRVQQYSIESFANTTMGALPYHNRQHTESVVFYAHQIANHYQLSDRDIFVVIAAAWLHDLGYAKDRLRHEEKGAEGAESFLTGLALPPEDIEAVKNCILATKLPQNPSNLLEEIVCDADLYHLGTVQFGELNKAMRSEFEEVKQMKISKSDWRNKTLMLLQSHHFHTEYVKQALHKQKQKNIEQLQEKIAEKTDPVLSALSPVPLTDKKPEEAHAKKKDSRPERGIETMFRVSSSNHQRLSDMADNKAHIMITVNSIILSAVISLLLRKLDDSSNLMLPTFMLLATSLITIIFSILATRPSIPSGQFTKQDIDEKKVNLLFFGNFYNMKLPDYKEGMEKMMDDKEYLYGSLIMDGYAQGIILGKKYHLLRVSYNVFMFGLIISVFAFILASAFYGK